MICLHNLLGFQNACKIVEIGIGIGIFFVFNYYDLFLPLFGIGIFFELESNLDNS